MTIKIVNVSPVETIANQLFFIGESMDNDAMIMIMDYKDYKVMFNKLFSHTSLISYFVLNG